jgi:DNA invertase Pin-like site-specific DNA recombinase
LTALQPGDVRLVWRFDRRERGSLPRLLKLIDALHARGCGLRLLLEAVETSNPEGGILLDRLARSRPQLFR